MSRFFIAITVTLLATMFLPGMDTSAQGKGNSGAAHACKQGGYLDLQRDAADGGGTFGSVGECVSYAARGGTLVELSDSGGSEDAPETDCSNWENLARAESPTEAFASARECVDYIDASYTPVDLESGSPPTTCPDWASLAPSDDPANAFDSEAECIAYINAGGDPVAAEAPQVTCPNWRNLAREGSPFVAFDIEAECVAFIEGGGTTVPHLGDGSPQEPTVRLGGEGFCGARVKISGFDADTTYSGTVGSHAFTITTDGDGNGSALVTLSRSGDYTATIVAGGLEYSDTTSIVCSASG